MEKLVSKFVLTRFSGDHTALTEVQSTLRIVVARNSKNQIPATRFGAMYTGRSDIHSKALDKQAVPTNF